MESSPRAGSTSSPTVSDTVSPRKNPPAAGATVFSLCLVFARPPGYRCPDRTVSRPKPLAEGRRGDSLRESVRALAQLPNRQPRTRGSVGRCSAEGRTQRRIGRRSGANGRRGGEPSLARRFASTNRGPPRCGSPGTKTTDRSKVVDSLGSRPHPYVPRSVRTPSSRPRRCLVSCSLTHPSPRPRRPRRRKDGRRGRACA
jgi:hypothetical protein